MTSKEYQKVYKEFMKKNDVFYVSEHRSSYGQKEEFKNIINKKLDLILMPISVTRFSAVKALLELKKTGLKIGIIHLVSLKPFKKRNFLNLIKVIVIKALKKNPYAFFISKESGGIN